MPRTNIQILQQNVLYYHQVSGFWIILWPIKALGLDLVFAKQITGRRESKSLTINYTYSTLEFDNKNQDCTQPFLKDCILNLSHFFQSYYYFFSYDFVL